MCGVTVRSRQLLDEGGHVVSLVRSERDMLFDGAGEEAWARKIGADAWFEFKGADEHEIQEQSLMLPNSRVSGGLLLAVARGTVAMLRGLCCATKALRCCSSTRRAEFATNCGRRSRPMLAGSAGGAADPALDPRPAPAASSTAPGPRTR